VPRILIIDDDEAVRGLLRHRLDGLYEIADTGDPAEALAMALQMKPDCILLDLMMPKFSGFELCQTLAALSYTQQIPIFIISGQPAAHHWPSCRKLGAAGYFEKPVNFDELKTRLSEILKGKQKEHRSQVRVRLNVTLKLRGTDPNGEPFEVLTHTDNVSANGFRCMCTVKLQADWVVGVSTVGDREEYVGQARVVWVELENMAWRVAGFRFVDKPRLWVLQ
jgi:DNA-binding response OmpR family regulator